MCLVSYIPIGNGFVLSSNRDEAPERSAQNIVKENSGNTTIYYPGDHAGGSWIIISEDNRLVCLLNGAFENHQRQLPYRMSRGVLMKEFFLYKDAVDFLKNYNCIKIEPFTMVIIDQLGLFEFIWDGQKKHINTLSTQETYIWSSATLYDETNRKKRKEWLLSEINQIDQKDSQTLIKCHLKQDSCDLANSLKMDRNGLVQTISHTQVFISEAHASVRHLNLLTSEEIPSLKLPFILR